MAAHIALQFHVTLASGGYEFAAPDHRWALSRVNAAFENLSWKGAQGEVEMWAAFAVIPILPTDLPAHEAAELDAIFEKNARFEHPDLRANALASWRILSARWLCAAKSGAAQWAGVEGPFRSPWPMPVEWFVELDAALIRSVKGSFRVPALENGVTAEPFMLTLFLCSRTLVRSLHLIP